MIYEGVKPSTHKKEMKEMNKNKKTALIALAAVLVAGAASITAVSVMQPSDTTPQAAPTPVVEETQAPEETEAPAPEETEEPVAPNAVDAWATYEETYSEWFNFPAGSTIATAGDLSKDCAAEQPPLEGNTLSGYSVLFADTEKTEPIEISCAWDGDQADFDTLLEGAIE